MGPFQSRLSWQKHTKKKKFQSLCQPPKHTQKMQFQSLCQPLIRHFLEDPFLQGKHRVNGQLLVTRKCLMDGTNLGHLSFDLFKINSDVCSFHFEIKLNFFLCVVNTYRLLSRFFSFTETQQQAQVMVNYQFIFVFKRFL